MTDRKAGGMREGLASFSAVVLFFVMSGVSVNATAGPARCTHLTGFWIPSLFGYEKCNVRVSNQAHKPVVVVVRYKEDGQWRREKETLDLGKTYYLAGVHPDFSWSGNQKVYWWAQTTDGEKTWQGRFVFEGDERHYIEQPVSYVWTSILAAGLPDVVHWHINVGGRKVVYDPTASRARLECRNQCGTVEDECLLKYAHDAFRRQRCLKSGDNCRKRC